MTTREWCDRCDAATEFEPHDTMPYTVICQWCGHHRIERTRSASKKVTEATSSRREVARGEFPQSIRALR